MLVDDYETHNNDRQDVVDINTDETLEDAVVELTADDCMYSIPYWERGDPSESSKMA